MHLHTPLLHDMCVQPLHITLTLQLLGRDSKPKDMLLPALMKQSYASWHRQLPAHCLLDLLW